MTVRVSSSLDVIRAIYGGAQYMSKVEVADGAHIDSAGISEKLDYYPPEGGTITVASSLNGWLNHVPGSTVVSVWDGEDRNRFFLPAGSDNARLILRGWPDKVVCSNRWLREEREGGLIVIRQELSHGRDGEESVSQPVEAPAHYVWLGGAILERGGPERTGDLQSWDVLDAIAPDDPHVWNALKYLTRLGRKGGASSRIVDLRKARTYLDRAISQEERNDTE